ncbi:MAG: hypothetical protein ABSD88_01425 [Candidatus Korobacteraceae bacterium]
MSAKVRTGRPHPGARLVLFCALAWALAGFGTTIRPATVEQLTHGSSHVVEGKATGSYAAWDAGHKAIYTYTTFEVGKILKGDLTTRTVLVKQFGGRVGNTVSQRIGVRQFAAGEEAVLFLFPSPSADGTMLVTGLMQGRFSVRRSGAAATVSNGVPQPSPATRIYEAGTPVAREHVMSLETLEQRVRSAVGGRERR